jgi:hypothetical protein
MLMRSLILATCLAGCSGGPHAPGALALGEASTTSAATTWASAARAELTTPARQPGADSAAPEAAAGDAPVPTRLLGRAASMTGLGYASTNPAATTHGVGKIAACMRGYSAPQALARSTPAPLPSRGGVFYTPAELALWRQRIARGPFVADGDFTRGSPGDWKRIAGNARRFMTHGEPAFAPEAPHSNIFTYGTLARDAAFHELITTDGTAVAPLRSHLLAQARNPALDFPTTLCITTLAGSTSDSRFAEATWLLRYVVTYDFVRGSLASAERVTIENFIRRNAYFLAATSDYGLATVFPARHSGNYAKRASAAAPARQAATWWAKHFDTNGDCTVDARDDATAYPMYAYVRSDGTLGPRISVLSQYYNNRRSVATTAYGAAGVLLGDADLIASAKRYFMEWLTYGVWADGSQGEYARNGDYCIAPQGLIYGASNEQGAAMLARLLARQGDHTLIEFNTTEGLFGSQSPDASSPKSLELVVGTRLKLLTGQLDWYFHQPWRATQEIGAGSSLGNFEVRYMGGKRAMDDYHELGLLPAAAMLNRLPLSGVVLRDRAVTSLRFPGATGNPVATGHGTWSDAFGALPAVLLLRP